MVHAKPSASGGLVQRNNSIRGSFQVYLVQYPIELLIYVNLILLECAPPPPQLGVGD